MGNVNESIWMNGRTSSKKADKQLFEISASLSELFINSADVLNIFAISSYKSIFLPDWIITPSNFGLKCASYYQRSPTTYSKVKISLKQCIWQQQWNSSWYLPSNLLFHINSLQSSFTFLVFIKPRKVRMIEENLQMPENQVFRVSFLLCRNFLALIK